MTQESYQALLPYAELMRTIIINAAASNLPIGYQQALKQAGTEEGFKLSCSCSSGWYALTTKVYPYFLKFSKSQNEQNKEKPRSKRNSKADKGE